MLVQISECVLLVGITNPFHYWKNMYPAREPLLINTKSDVVVLILPVVITQNLSTVESLMWGRRWICLFMI